VPRSRCYQVLLYDDGYTIHARLDELRLATFGKSMSIALANAHKIALSAIGQYDDLCKVPAPYQKVLVPMEVLFPSEPSEDSRPQGRLHVVEDVRVGV
jgi:hypothetical protein